MKNTFLVSYDIMDSERLQKVYKVMKGFGEHAQYSVFICHLNQKEKVMLKEALSEIINNNKDRVLMVDLGPSDGTSKNRIEVLGNQDTPKEPSATVV
ncbi:MAG: CRISPR-associated endonuclease Cas2 [Candidatus ainarchaeum sp.]|nr:CRISPR-associated endonuclease Cas2 [Candidatus ainarchaeum sp.]